MRDIQLYGIDVESILCGVDPQFPPSCPSYNTWASTTITDNTIEAGHAGIKFHISGTGDRVDGATITDNVVRVTGEMTDTGIALETGGNADEVTISDVLIARNSIEGEPKTGITVAAGAVRSQRSTVQRVRVVNNSIHLTGPLRAYCCTGIVVMAGSDDPSFATMSDPPRYLDDNLVRDVLVRGNSVSGTLDGGVSVQAGIGGGGRRNRVTDIRVERNTIRTSKPGIGVVIIQADGTQAKDHYATGNLISTVSIDRNRITIGKGPQPENAGGGAGAGGVVIQAGGNLGRGNAVRNVRISKNAIATAYVGIRVIGGVWPTARGNSVACVRLAGNRVTGTRRAVSVVSNARGATGNRVSLAC